jgi:hypothetical protein
MFKSLKSFLINLGWFTVGVTAIAVEESYKAGKIVADAVKDGDPQEYARYQVTRFRCKETDHQNCCNMI